MGFDPKQHIIKLQGKDYLEVKWRIVWFRDRFPNGVINTELLSTEPVIVRCAVYDGDGAKLASGHGSVPNTSGRAVWSGREIEKAETAAIGRALAHAGFGTQFDADDEGDFLADSPIEPEDDGKKKKGGKKKPKRETKRQIVFRLLTEDTDAPYTGTYDQFEDYLIEQVNEGKISTEEEPQKIADALRNDPDFWFSQDAETEDES